MSHHTHTTQCRAAENTIRRMARKCGLRIIKSRRRYVDKPYAVVDRDRNQLIHGDPWANHGLTLQQVDDFVRHRQVNLAGVDHYQTGETNGR